MATEVEDILECTPLEGIQPLRLGMTLDEANGVFGAPESIFAARHEAFWGSELPLLLH